MRATCVVLLVLGTSPAAARLEPVLRSEVPALERQRTRLFVVRPCDVHLADPSRRRQARHRRLLPGDAVRVRPGKRPVPVALVATAEDGVAYRIKVECLGRSRPDYNYRGKGSFKQFYHGLVRDLPRLMDVYVKLMEKHRFHIPVTDRTTGQLSDDYNRADAIRDHLRWVRSQLFSMGYSGRSERTVLKKEADWITRRGEEFIRGFAGGAEPAVKEELKQIYLLLNRLDSVPGTCGRLRRLQEELEKLAQDTGKYRDLEPVHRERLRSEDLTRLHAQIGEWRTKLATTVVEVRTALMALGIKVR